MKKFETMITQKKQYDGKIINVRLDEVEVDNHQRLREVVEHPGGVCILAINHKNEALVVEQYRYGVEQFLLELPAGKKEINEDSLLTAKRELLEETGFKANTWIDFGVFYPSPAYLNEVIHCYVASDLTASSQQLDEGEYLDTYFLHLDLLKDKVLSNEIRDGKTIACVTRYLLMQNE